MTLRLHKDRPAGTEPAECVINAPGDGNQFSRHRGIEIRSAEPRGTLE